MGENFRESVDLQKLADFVRLYFREWLDMENFAWVYFCELGKNKCILMDISHIIGVTFWKKEHGELTEELNLVFHLFYTKNWNKHEAYAMTFKYAGFDRPRC